MGKIKVEVKPGRSKNVPAINKAPVRMKTGATVSAANIKVVVRVRPPNQREEGDCNKIVIGIVDDRCLIFDPKENEDTFFYHGVKQKHRDLLRKPNKDLEFMFDKVFGYDVTNQEIFQETTKNLIESLMEGYNCSVFAYGATGAGKTHTMLGHSENPGITYLTMTELFKAKQDLSAERDFQICMTYLEVYNETVKDLLNPGGPLQLREDVKYGVTVAGIKMHKIENPQKLFSLLEQGNSNRTQHPTDSNAESSRSHAVFQVYIQMKIKSTREVRGAKLSMIDLAGSERGSATGFSGARFTEGANINKSLLALGNCINSLADGQKHVPYRNSKLTRLLKDSLGGNCQTVMVANISPSSYNYEDTYNTLKYATRAKKIKSHIKKNVVNVELSSAESARIIDELQKELERFKSHTCDCITMQNAKPTIDSTLTGQLRKLMEERKKLLEREFNVELSENVVVLRRQFKELADSRISDLGMSTPEKKHAHRRLGNAMNRFHKQEDTFRTELTDIKHMKQELERKTTELIEKYPELSEIAKVENAQLVQLEAQYKVEIMDKKQRFYEDELKSSHDTLKSTWQLLRPCYLQLRGIGYASDDLIKDYEELVKNIQGKKNITWEEGIGDSGISTTTSKASIFSEPEIRRQKRKMNDENVNNNNSPLDGTFTMEAPKSKMKLFAEEIMYKACKSTPLKEPIGRHPRIGRDRFGSASHAKSPMQKRLQTTKGTATATVKPRFRT